LAVPAERKARRKRRDESDKEKDGGEAGQSAGVRSVHEDVILLEQKESDYNGSGGVEQANSGIRGQNSQSSNSNSEDAIRDSQLSAPDFSTGRDIIQPLRRDLLVQGEKR
jgi:hypothetical protein